MIAIVAARRSGPRPGASRSPAPRAAPARKPSAATGAARPAIPGDTPAPHGHDDAGGRTPVAQDVRWPTAPGPDTLVRVLIENLGHIATPTAAHMWLFDPATDTLRLIAAAGPLPPAALPVPMQDTLLGRALTTGTHVLAPLNRLRSRSADAAMWRFAIPIEAGESRGVVAIDFRSDSEPNRTLLLRAAPGLESSAAGALALYVSRQETAAARVLFEAARDLTRLLAPSEVIDTMLERGMTLSGASTGSVMLLDQESGDLTIAASKGLPEGVAESVAVSRGEGVVGLVFASGKPLVVEDLPGRATRSRRHGVRTAVSVPIADEDGILGVLNVGSKTFSARFSNLTLATLEALGTMGAVALRNALAARLSADLHFDTLRTLALALETKDPFAHGGTERVVGCAVALGKRMGLDESEARALEIAALLHDIGMIATGDASGVRERPLTIVEWGLLKMHPVIAAELLEQAPTLRAVAPIVYYHHEHYDGSGYATGLAGESIPLAARVLSVADAYVAMTSDRPYRKAMAQEAALKEMAAMAGSQFDPHVVEALHGLIAAESAEVAQKCT